jgi:adenylate cyclase
VYTRDDGVDLAGVEIAATAFANLLSDEALRPLGLWQTLALLAAFVLPLGLAAALLPALWGVIACVVLWIAYAALAQWQFAAAQWWPLVLPLLVLAPLALFLGVFGQYRFERSRGLRISEAINYYLPENIAREFAAGTLTTEATNNVTYGTCFATDMAGFSSIAEGMGPAELARFLNEYFEVLAAALRGQAVDVTEFRADAIMCAWLGREQDSENRRRAVRAALQARDVIAEFGGQHDSSLGKLRVGLECGWFYVGHSGGGGHFVYSIVGDCANTASRLEGLNKYLGTQIIASREVVDGLDGFELRPLGLFKLKGRDGAIEVVEVLGEEPGDGAAPWLQLFGEALADFQAGHPERALAGFERVLQQRPADGPSAFFCARCRENSLLAETAATDDALAPRMVVMEDK